MGPASMMSIGAQTLFSIIFQFVWHGWRCPAFAFLALCSPLSSVWGSGSVAHFVPVGEISDFHVFCILALQFIAVLGSGKGTSGCVCGSGRDFGLPFPFFCFHLSAF